MEMIFQIFQQADANRDGSVTKAELTAAMQTHARAGRPGRGGPPPQQQNQARGNQRRPGGPPPRPENQADHPRPEHGEHGHQGPPPEPGQVLPEPIADSLNLNAKQTRDLAALQADVDKRLADILTDEQKEQLENPRPPHGPGQVEGERGERPAGRPQRRQRPE